MKVLIVKTSSLGDVIHTFPALTDAAMAIPDIHFDWVVEEAFAEVPAWHFAVNKVIPVAIRRWRKKLFKVISDGEWKAFKNELSKEKYDCVIDAQGLLKSAWLTRYANTSDIHGLDKFSAREPMSRFFYKHKHAVKWEQHAVERVRQLFALSLHYKLPATMGSFNLTLPSEKVIPDIVAQNINKLSIVFLHGTTWKDKHWPDVYWKELAQMAQKNGYIVYLPWGNTKEKIRAESIAEHKDNVHVLPKLSLAGVAAVISQATGVVSVDSGLGHLTAALDVPAVSLYGPTSPKKVGTYGKEQVHLTLKDGDKNCHRNVLPKIFTSLTPKCVWDHLTALLSTCSRPSRQIIS